MGLCHTYSVLPKPVYGHDYCPDLSHIPAYGFRKVHYRLRARQEGIVAAKYGRRRIEDWLLEYGYLHSPVNVNIKMLEKWKIIMYVFATLLQPASLSGTVHL